MPTPKLRIFNDGTSLSDHETSLPAHRACSVAQVPVALGDVLPLLMHAARSNRLWLDDFGDETVEISQDLYEVLLAYKPIAEQTGHLVESKTHRRRAS